MPNLFSKKKRVKEAHGPEVPVEEHLDWTEQHHTKTLQSAIQNALSQPVLSQPTMSHAAMSHATMSQTNVQSAHNLHQNVISSGFDLQSGDETDHIENTLERQRNQFYITEEQKRTKEYHIEQALQAVELLKIATKPTGWKKVDKHKSGCIVYQSTATQDKHPAFKGEHVIRGFRAQDVFSVVGVRKLWDDWYDELSCVETYDDETSLMYMVMKGTLSSKTRDVAMVERIEIERDGTIYFAACSVESNKIPRIAGKVRSEIFIAGWVIQPLPSNPPITKITYVIQTDLLSRLPKFIAKRALAKRSLAITIIETHLKKNGTPLALSSPTVQRPRSMSEPMKPGFLLPEDSEDDTDLIPSGSAFLMPMEPIKPRKGEERAEASTKPKNAPQAKVLQPAAPIKDRVTSRDSLSQSFLSSNSLFSAEFLENNSFLGDTALFGDSLLFGKGGAFENTAGPSKDAAKTPSQLRNQSSSPRTKLPIQQKQQIREQEEAPLPTKASAMTPEPEVRKRTPIKRVSIPVVNPKSEARSKPYAGTLPVTPEPSVVASAVALTPATPPLTPTASLDGKEVVSDSDAREDATTTPTPKTPTPAEPSSPTLPSAIAFTSFGMRSPSAMMEARRHSGMLNRGSSFAPRHSHVIPIRGNPNVSLQSLTRPSGPNGTMTTAMKRHSTAPSMESTQSANFTPMTVLPHRHSETARKALAMFKVLASSSEDRWRAISSEAGFKSYSRVISGAGLPMLRGEGTITGGWTVEQINAVIESSGCRQIWDERFENMSIAETFNHNEYLFHVTLRGVGSLTGRDLAGVTLIDRDPQTSALFNVSTSVLDSTIPEDPGRIRAMLELSGWSLRPTFDGQGNTVSVNVTFVIQIDIRGNLPPSVVKSMTSSMTMAVSRLNQFINKTGYPPFASHISGTRLLDTFDTKTGFYELCYKAAPGWTEVRVGRKVYKEGYDFFIKPDDPSVRVELAPDFGGVRVWTTLDHEGQSIVAQVSRKGQHVVPPTEAEKQQQEEEEEVKRVAEAKRLEDAKHAEEQSNIKVDVTPSTKNTEVAVAVIESLSPGSPTSARNKRRSASYATLSNHESIPVRTSSRPDSQASIASKASQSSERSRTRGRSARQVTLPAGTPPPPLPRRSSSLSRYSIPISPYLPEADAPPLPVSTPAVASLLASSAPQVDTMVSVRQSVAESISSPTLGPFHVPHVPTLPPLSSEDKSEAVLAPAPHLESITAVLSDSAPTTPTIETPTVSLASSVATLVVASPEAVKAVEPEIESLATISSPAASPVPSNMPAFMGASTTFQPASKLKHSNSAISVGGTRRPREVRVTFALDKSEKVLEQEKMSVKGSSPLDELLSLQSIKAGSVKESTVVHHAHQAQHHHHHQVDAAAYGILESQSQEYESDEAEFVEARAELSSASCSEDESSVVVKTVAATATLKKDEQELIVVLWMAFEGFVRQMTPTQIKFALVFVLLAYYAGRLSPLIS